MILYWLFLFIGFFFLIEGANLLLNGSIELAKKYHLSEIIIGLTVVAFGTSAPELSVSIIGSIKGNSSIVVGDILGSNILNIGLVLAITGLFLPIPIKNRTKKFDLPVCLFVTILFPLLLLNNYFSRIEGIFFLIIFLFTMYIWYKNRHAPITEEIKKHKYSNWKIFFLILSGMIGLCIGGEITVRNAVKIAQYLKISQTTIAVTVVAVGTSLPELVTSIVAIMKKKADLSIGNIIGSNIFNFLLCLGVAGLIRPFGFPFMQNIFTILGSIYFVVILFLIIILAKKLSRIGSLFLILSYMIYIIILL